MRYGSGGVRKQRGKWIGFWREGGKQVSEVLGLANEMTKGEAREAVAEIVKRIKKDTNPKLFGPFVEGPYFDFYTGKWKSSTADNNKQRIRTHLVEPLRERDLASIRRDELQGMLDAKSKTYSFSVVDHLRWDVKQIFDMAIAEGILKLNPAALLYTPNAAKRPKHRTMTVEQIRTAFGVLAIRERVIFKLAILGGMRPGEIFVLRRKRLAQASAEITERIYRGKIDTPKTHNSVREAALAEGLKEDLDTWAEMSRDRRPEAFLFPSERGTALSKDNVWRRNMQPALAKVGLGWCNFQVMRRTHGTLMRQMKADPHAVAAQLGHTVDVSLNTYAQSPVETRVALVNDLERLIAGEPERCADAVQKRESTRLAPKTP
jgi:integrase